MDDLIKSKKKEKEKIFEQDNEEDDGQKVATKKFEKNLNG